MSAATMRRHEIFGGPIFDGGRAGWAVAPYERKILEATGRFELPNGAFAELCLTTWLRRHSQSGWRESNPRVNLGKVAGYHYITPAHEREAHRSPLGRITPCRSPRLQRRSERP